MKITESKLRKVVRNQLQIKKLSQLHEKMTGKVNLQDQQADENALTGDVVKFFEMLKSKSQLTLAASRLNTKEEKIDAIALFSMAIGVEDVQMLTQALPKVKKKIQELQAGQQKQGQGE